VQNRGRKLKVHIRELIAVFILAGILLVNVRMPLANAASQSSINTAIAKALVYLNGTQASDGHWGGSLNPVASTAMTVLAFENGGHYGWNATDPYNNTVQNGLNWLFQMGTNVTISNQTAGNPDTNGNGIGVAWDPNGYPIYETPMVLMAMVASSTPTNLTQTGPLGVRTYHDIAVDIVDYLAWAQVDSGTGRGGWTYAPADNSSGEYSEADNSNSAWPTMALLAAQLWGINAPAFVKSELNIWITTCQDLTGNSTSNSNYGSFGYSGKDAILGGLPEAAIGIAELTYVGAYSTNASVIAAEGYINKMWNVNDGSWNVNIGSLYAMYAVMKACREALPPIQFIANYDGTPSVEWYNGTGQYADSLIANQSSDGSWNIWEPWAESDSFSTDLSTAFGTLILEPYVVNIATKYTLTVTVEDATNNNPITGAAVQAAGPESMSGNTGSNGKITFNSVQAGTYLVNASASGYSPSGTTVSVTSTTAVTIKLSPTAPTTPTQPKVIVGGRVEPVNTLAVLFAAVQDTLSKYSVALLAVGAVAVLLIFKRRRK
jgi:hypothetical protein